MTVAAESLPHHDEWLRKRDAALLDDATHAANQIREREKVRAQLLEDGDCQLDEETEEKQRKKVVRSALRAHDRTVERWPHKNSDALLVAVFGGGGGGGGGGDDVTTAAAPRVQTGLEHMDYNALQLATSVMRSGDDDDDELSRMHYTARDGLEQHAQRPIYSTLLPRDYINECCLRASDVGERECLNGVRCVGVRDFGDFARPLTELLLPHQRMEWCRTRELPTQRRLCYLCYVSAVTLEYMNQLRTKQAMPLGRREPFVDFYVDTENDYAVDQCITDSHHCVLGLCEKRVPMYCIAYLNVERPDGKPPCITQPGYRYATSSYAQPLFCNGPATAI